MPKPRTGCTRPGGGSMPGSLSGRPGCQGRRRGYGRDSAITVRRCGPSGPTRTCDRARAAGSRSRLDGGIHRQISGAGVKNTPPCSIPAMTSACSCRSPLETNSINCTSFRSRSLVSTTIEPLSGTSQNRPNCRLASAGTAWPCRRWPPRQRHRVAGVDSAGLASNDRISSCVTGVGGGSPSSVAVGEMVGPGLCVAVGLGDGLTATVGVALARGVSVAVGCAPAVCVAAAVSVSGMSVNIATCVRYSDVALTSGVAVLKGGVGVRVGVGVGRTQPTAEHHSKSSSTACFSMVNLSCERADRSVQPFTMHSTHTIAKAHFAPEVKGPEPRR